MDGLIANIGSVHVFVWAFAGVVGLLLGTFLARRDVIMGTVLLILGVLAWSMFVGLLPILNHAISADGLAGIMSGRGFAAFLEGAAPQAIFNEPRAHRNEVLQSAFVGAVIFAVAGLLGEAVMRPEEDGL